MSAPRRPGFVPWPDALAERYRELGVWRGQSLFAALAERAAQAGERVAAVDRERRISYAALCQRSEALARGLAASGIGAGDAVLVQLPNCIAFLEVCFALFRLGAQPVMAQPAHRRLELTEFARRTGAVAHVICERFARFDYRALAAEVREACPSVRLTLVAGESARSSAAPAEQCLERLFEPGPEQSLPPLPPASAVALFQLSGGSTDVPKLIARTHDDYLYSVRTSNEVCGFTAGTVYLAVLPVAHNFPLSSPGALGTLLAGGKLVLSEQPTPDLAFDWIEREGVTATALVPALLPAWLAAAARRKRSLASLALLQVGGAKLHESMARRVQPELGAQLQQVFGMAEGLVCYTRPSDPLASVLTTQGRPMSVFDELRVVDAEGCDVAAGEVGQLWTRGPYTIRGYYDAPEHNAQAFNADGFYCTGDCVRRLPDGSLVVEGRVKDQINRGGEKIAAPEVEAQLCSHPAVEAAALVPMSDPYLGERSCAFVVAQGVGSKELLAHLRRAGLASYKIPDRIELIDSLPKTPVGKIDKRRLRSLAEAHQSKTAHVEKHA
jgi:2,3-dihydroxybenzoate-AMP ligase